MPHHPEIRLHRFELTLFFKNTQEDILVNYKGSRLSIIFRAQYAKPKQKLQYLIAGSGKIDLLKFFLQIGWENKLIDNKKYLALSKKFPTDRFYFSKTKTLGHYVVVSKGQIITGLRCRGREPGRQRTRRHARRASRR